MSYHSCKIELMRASRVMHKFLTNCVHPRRVKQKVTIAYALVIGMQVP